MRVTRSSRNPFKTKWKALSTVLLEPNGHRLRLYTGWLDLLANIPLADLVKTRDQTSHAQTRTDTHRCQPCAALGAESHWRMVDHV